MKKLIISTGKLDLYKCCLTSMWGNTLSRGKPGAPSNHLHLYHCGNYYNLCTVVVGQHTFVKEEKKTQKLARMSALG